MASAAGAEAEENLVVTEEDKAFIDDDGVAPENQIDFGDDEDVRMATSGCVGRVRNLLCSRFNWWRSIGHMPIIAITPGTCRLASMMRHSRLRTSMRSSRCSPRGNAANH